MPSTKNPHLLPDCNTLRSVCKAISVLDAILSPEWEFRYYSYSSEWGEGEECLQMHNGHGDEMHILFAKTGCAINGFAHEYPQPDKKKLTEGLPGQFNQFIFGEPVSSIGTTFCLWNVGDGWRAGEIESSEDNSEEMLAVFHGGPQTYIEYASEYFEADLPLGTVTSIYNGETLTKEMVLSAVEEVADWKALEKELNEIDYPFDFPETPEPPKKGRWNFL